MYKAIIFDFFDVIAPDFYRVWLEKNGYTRTEDFLAIAQDIDSGRIDLEEYYSRLSGFSGQSVRSLQDEFENDTQLNQNLIQLITKLRQNYQIGLLTNSPSNMVRLILKKNGLESHFDQIVISGEVGCVKPDRQIFELALERLKIRASEAVFIDDLQTYIEGAESVGIIGIKFNDINQLKTDLRNLGILTDN